MVQRKIGQQGSSAKEGGETKMRMNKETPRVMPNYMKPTTSSDARKEQRQVTAAADRKRRSNRSSNRSSQASVFCPSSQARALRRKLSSKLLRLLSSKRSFAVHPCPRPKVNRATCSSTLKDLLKFPKALELRPGGAEADGTSVTKVCPYKYCSLNGHWHADLPPLRCFLASRRKKMLKAHKCMKQKGVSPFRRQGSSKDTKQMDTGQAAVKLSSLIEEIGSDYFVEIYVKQEEDMECFKHEEHVILEGDVDHSSDLSVDDLEVMMTFLEYVSCEEFPSSTTEERWTSAATGKDHAEEVSEPSEIELEEDVDPFADDKSYFSDDEFGTILGMLFENEVHHHQSEAEACHEECSRAPEAESLQENGNGGSEDSAIDSDKAVSIDIKEDQASSLLQVRIPSADQDDDIEDEEEEEDDHQIQSEPEVENDDLSTVGNAALNRSIDDDGDPNARTNTTSKRREEEETRGFNPRPPNFLPEEPDPEAEKVDLRHHMMDERKNSEEWMIDYALQQAVTKLAPARRQKVALLVEAFETVIPLPVCDKPLRHATQSFSSPWPMQACN
ncbi:hypothetical protein OPV22_000202 [Ensete ventricosum]|uniref:Calmodulin-binding domain-containing protein n=1 Tax=Ensete ventricosum TaxID=4639 RepID=A0AAV8RST4_ENSVE|nr:hypothetical protein OPV22_000202 [Ensete ventricosum]